MAFIVILWEQFLPDFHDVRVVLTKNSYYLCVCPFTIMLMYYCMDLTTKGLWLLDRAKVFTVPSLLVQTISLGDKVLPPPSIARHAGFRSSNLMSMRRYELTFLCGSSKCGNPRGRVLLARARRNLGSRDMVV